MHIYQGPNGDGDTTPEQLYEYIEQFADDPDSNQSDIGTLPELTKRYAILDWMDHDQSLLYEPVVLKLTIGLTHIELKPVGWK